MVESVKFRIACFLFNLYIVQGTIQDTLNYYETMNWVDMSHKIVKRSLDNVDHIKHISFKTHGENFKLNLVPSKDVFDPMFQAVSIDSRGVEKLVHINKDNYYKGYDEIHEGSEVVAHLENGVVQMAKISMDNDTIFIEPMWRHDTPTHDMIVYKASNVNSNLTHNHSQPSSCGVDETMYKNLNSYEEERNYTRRSRRNIVTDKNTCDLVLVADYLFFKHMGGSNIATTINYMLQVADRVNRLYRKTSWDGVGENIGFQVRQAIVYESYSEDKPWFNQKRNRWNVDTLLTQFSYTNWKSFCLAHLFTYQDFDRGVIGLAYVANNPSLTSVGGICTSHYQDQIGWRYLNCGLSSSLNWNRRLLTIEADLVTAHEFGHNFGSSHDPQSCAPRIKDGGKYIMYATSVSGESPNNKLFSPCSRRSIGQVLRMKRRLCFKNQQNSYCGNSLVEEGEECDSGLNPKNDSCCASNCRYKKRAFQCNDANDQCCKNCFVVPSTVVCREKSALVCKAQTTCDGISKSCPKISPPLNGDSCGFSKGNCVNGVCKPLCELEIPPKYSCSCSSEETACKICCKSSNSSSALCIPLKTANNSYINENDGMPCVFSSEQGQCISGACKKSQRNIEDEFSSLLNDFTFSKFARFMEANIVGTILVFSLMIWIPASCIVHYLDKKSDEEDEQMKVWQNPKNKELFQKLSSDKFKMMFRGGNTAKKYPRTQYHISS